MHEKGFTESDVDASSYLLDVLMAISHYLSSFLFTLWSWAKLYNADNLSTLVDFLSWLGHR